MNGTPRLQKRRTLAFHALIETHLENNEHSFGKTRRLITQDGILLRILKECNVGEHPSGTMGFLWNSIIPVVIPMHFQFL